jgi:hypothetical protein
MLNEDEIDDFEALLADKKRSDLVVIMGKVLTELQKQKPDDGVKAAIEKQGKAIEKVADAIANIPKPEKPEKPQVNVELNQTEILPLLKEIKEGQIALIEAFNNKPMVSEFNFVYEYGSVKTAKVIYKPANQITYSKPKAQA